MSDRELLQYALRFMADLCGSEWIKGDSVGAIDMRQRAKAIQRKLSWAIYPDQGRIIQEERQP